MYCVFKCICIIKRNTSGLWLRLSPALSKKDFWPARELIIPQTWFSEMRWFIHCVYIYWFSNPSSFNPSRITFILFLQWARDFAHSLIFLLFQVRCCFSSSSVWWTSLTASRLGGYSYSYLLDHCIVFISCFLSTIMILLFRFQICIIDLMCLT